MRFWARKAPGTFPGVRRGSRLGCMRSFFTNIPKVEARAAVASLVSGVALLVLKFAAYFLTNSSAIFTDAVESIVNVAAAGFAIYSLGIAHRPADVDHPYGHGKVEFLAAGFEGSMILSAALVASVRAIDAIIHHAPLHFAALGMGLALMAIALTVNGLLGAALVRLGRRTGSATLEADGHHLLSDAVTSMAAIVGLLTVHLLYKRWEYASYADPIVALAVAFYIGRTGVRLMHGAVGGLMDRQDVEDEKLLSSILDAHVGPHGNEPRICSYHKLRHRHSGRYHWVDFHIMVPADWDIDGGHLVASSIEYEIEQSLGIGNATAHVEPCRAPQCPQCTANKT
ncbi:MAG: cation diffusion facilitator family transporter [Phycisphaerales bacterium]|nr:cation diffusion facilitator family transporter [Phycisphaerales bacterium]